MGKYRQCPNCYSQSKGVTVVRCSKCGKVYCSNCKGFQLFGGYKCPSCDSTSYGSVGTVDPNA